MRVTLDRYPEPAGVFQRDDELADAGHEQVVFCRDEQSGLRAIIAIHDTTLGPALGGTRFFPYPSESAALRDALRLAQGMTFKAAAAGLPFGGGKAVIIGDPATAKSPALLRAYGRFIDRLGGTYVTAADVGTTSDDLDLVGEATRHVVGRTVAAGGSGDSGLSTARGVVHAMRAAARLTWPVGGLDGRRVGVEGAGKVGLHLVGLLLDEGARVILCDPSAGARQRVMDAYGQLPTAPSLLGVPMDIYAPCAMG
jgi:valine dehydrogenase (NAD+)